ncbi:hypothetical protein [Geodermatophilus ruber]|uniref:Uncharacterized protein n=1 Tax=Geodermatophilus ruber TaxID=504800 RepID=A0A1I4A4B7_9ACTN|nr:hypothetical protein [Geodermatophilus ruber]SFK51212.1 hypothetical protein SAMN04488085_10270 [Geodermatophilus ruber]
MPVLAIDAGTTGVTALVVGEDFLSIAAIRGVDPELLARKAAERKAAPQPRPRSMW